VPTKRIGWVPICPANHPDWPGVDGPWWAYAKDTRVEVIQDLLDHLSEDNWASLYRQGWRIVRCQVAAPKR
jgi:hypothetical protein